jgi:predicted outer membrane repeat protein
MSTLRTALPGPTAVIIFLLVSASWGGAVTYVDRDAPGPGHNGASWDTAFLTIQQGVDAATPGGEVWVADGTYVENIVMGQGVQLYGGFLGAEPGGYETLLSQRNFALHIATIDGDQSGPCVEMAVGAGVDGFTITNGSGKIIELPDGYQIKGGGFYCEELGDTGAIENNNITANGHEYVSGGGIYCIRSSPRIADDDITDNNHEGVFCADRSSPLLERNVIARQTGCGIWCEDYSSPLVVDNTITENDGWYGGIHCERYTSPVILGNVITGNIARDGGGIGCVDNVTAIIADNLISGNTAQHGGGVYGSDSTLSVRDNEISNNTADGGGGILVSRSQATLADNAVRGNLAGNEGGGIHIVECVVLLTGNTITDNRARLGYGGGVSCTGSSGCLVGNLVRRNRVTLDRPGGGILISDSDLVVAGNSIMDNTCGGVGGGLSISGTGVVEFFGNSVAGNLAVRHGGGAYVTGPNVAICDSDFIENTAQGYGAGIYVQCPDEHGPSILDCLILGNQTEDSGGGIACWDAWSPVIANTIIVGNGAGTEGGGVWSKGSTPRLLNNVVAANGAAIGAGLYCGGGHSAILADTVVSGNTALMSGGGIYCTATSTPTVTHNNFWANAPQDYWGCVPGPGDISADPLFVDPADGDYHLAGGSPCIDAGVGLIPGLPYKDFEGDPRSCDGNGDGVAIVDIGADEYREPSERTRCQEALFGPGWTWFSIPLVPVASADAAAVLGFNCRNRVFGWLEPRRTVQIYPDDFTELAVGTSYAAYIRPDEQQNPVYEGSQPELPFERPLLTAGWCWVGVPSTQDVYGLDLAVCKDGVVRSAAEDHAAPDPWLNWNWIWWASVARSVGIMDPFGGGDDEWVHPWYGYRVWAYTENVTIIFP